MSDFKNKTFKEVLEEDIQYLRKILNDRKDLLHWDDEYAGWFCDDEPLEMNLFMEENTILNPKELMGYAEEIIEDEMNLKR